MDRAPEPPGGRAVEAEPAEIGDGALAADGGKAALVAIDEWRVGGPSAQFLADQHRHMPARLLGGGREAGHGLALPAEARCRIA